MEESLKKKIVLKGYHILKGELRSKKFFYKSV